MQRNSFQRVIALLAALAAVLGAPGTAAAQCFAQSGACVGGRFAEYWSRHGGMAVFGVSLAEAAPESSADGVSRSTQWFERNRFEHHPENAAPYDVLLGRLGEDRLRQLGRNWRAEGGEAGPQDGCEWFAQTGHNLCDQEAGAGFLSFWRSHGIESDGAAGFSYAESLALFGQALTSPAVETNSSGHAVATQWFERARFEWHAQMPAGSRVLLGLVGSELRGWQPPEPALPTLSGPLARMAELVDRLHQQACGEPFRRDERINRAAQAHADDIARHRRIDHIGTDGATLKQRLERAGYRPLYHSEGIAIYPTADEAVAMWMDEPPNGAHRLNIVNCQYVDNGFGLGVDANGRNWWVMDVANPR